MLASCFMGDLQRLSCVLFACAPALRFISFVSLVFMSKSEIGSKTIVDPFRGGSWSLCWLDFG